MCYHKQEGSQLEHFPSEVTAQVYFDTHSLIQKFHIYPPDPVDTPMQIHLFYFVLLLSTLTVT